MSSIYTLVVLCYVELYLAIVLIWQVRNQFGLKKKKKKKKSKTFFFLFCTQIAFVSCQWLYTVEHVRGPLYSAC